MIYPYGEIVKLSKESGLKYQTLYRRLKTLKWDESIAKSTPPTTPRAYKKIIKKLNGSNCG
jgi:hypothetical protein